MHADPASAVSSTPSPAPRPARTGRRVLRLFAGDAPAWLTAILAAGAAWGLARATGCSGLALRFYPITAAALTLWITGCFPESLVAALAPAVYILAGVGTPGDILSVWASPIGWLVFGGLIISEMMAATGIGRRAALWALRLSGASLSRLLGGVVLAGFLVAPFVPTGMGKAALFVIILTGVYRTLGLRPGGREASCLFLAGLTAVSAPKFLFLTSSIDAALLVELARKAGMSISWFSYLRDNAVPGLIYTAGSVLLLRLMLRRRPGDPATGQASGAGETGADLRAFVEREYRSLGPLTAREGKGLLILGVLAAAMITDAWHGVDIGWIMLVAAGACFLPGLRLLKPDCVPRLPLHVVFYVVGSMSIGAAAHAAGVDRDLAGALLSLVGNADGPGAFVTVYGAGTGLLMTLTSLPAVSTFAPALAGLGTTPGGTGQALIYALLYGLDQFLMPYAFGPALFIFASGYVGMRRFLAFEGVKFVLTAVFLMTVAWPYWRFVL